MREGDAAGVPSDRAIFLINNIPGTVAFIDSFD